MNTSTILPPPCAAQFKLPRRPGRARPALTLYGELERLFHGTTGERIPAVSSHISPQAEAPASNAQSDVAWRKIVRARELLDAEINNLRTERLALRQREAMVQQQEESLAKRETRLAVRLAEVALREQELATALAAQRQPKPQPRPSWASFIRRPFSFRRSAAG